MQDVIFFLEQRKLAVKRMFLLQFSAASLVFPIGDLLYTADALLPRSKSVLQAKNIMIIFAHSKFEMEQENFTTSDVQDQHFHFLFF